MSTVPAAEDTAPEVTDDRFAGLFSEAEVEEEEADVIEEAPADEADEAPETAEVHGELDLTGLEEEAKIEAPKPETPAVQTSDFFKKVQSVLPNEETLNYAVESFQRQVYFERAVQQGNFDAALQAMPSVEKIVQHRVNEYVKAHRDQILDDYIAEQTGANQRNPEVDALKAQLAQVQNYLQNGEQQNAIARENQAKAQRQSDDSARVKALDSEITGLFDKVRFTKDESERSLVTDLVKVALSHNGPAMTKIFSGDLAALRPVFKTAVERYVQLDKAKTEKRVAVQSKTQTSVPVITKGSVGSTTKLSRLEQASNLVAKLAKGH